MEVLLLTTLFSVVFAVFFLALFIRNRQTRPFGGIEREALLPLDDESEIQPADDLSAPLKKKESPEDSSV